MASVSKNPSTDTTQTRTRFASTPPPGCQRLLLLLAPSAAGRHNVLQGNPLLPTVVPKTRVTAKTTAPRGVERERCLSLAGACQVSDEPRVSEREPGANTLRKIEVWLLLAETFLDHLVSSWVSDTPRDPSCNRNVEREAARGGLWGRRHCWSGK